MNDIMRRCIAALAAFALVLVSPGLPAYAAAGGANRGTPGTPRTPQKVVFTPGSAARMPLVPGASNAPGKFDANLKLPGTSIPAPAATPSAKAAAAKLSDTSRFGVPAVPAKAAALPSPQTVAAQGGVALTDAQLATLAAETFSERPAIGYHYVALTNHFRSKPVEDVPAVAAAPAPAGAVGFDLTGRGAVDIGLRPASAPGAAPGAAPEAAAESDGTPAPPTAPGQASKPAEPALPGKSATGSVGDLLKGIFSIGRVALLFIAALVVAQVGIESQSAALPALMEAKFGDFTLATELTVTAMFAGFWGRVVAPKVIDKFGLKKTFLGALIMRTALMGSVVALLYFNAMSIPLLFGLFALNGFISGISITAEMSIPPEMVGKDPDKLENFWALEQTAVEVIGIAGPILTGALLASVGYLPLMLAFPVTFAIAIAMLWMFLRLPAKVVALDKADKAGVKPKKRSIGNGFKVVWNNPVLKYSFLAYTAVMMTNPFLYGILASAYGMLVAGGVPEVAAGAYGMITGLYSFGGLLAGFWMIWESYKLKKKMNPPPGSGFTALKQDTVDEQLRLSMLKWAKWSVFALALIGSFAVPFSGLWFWGLTLPAIALIPFGLAQVAASLKLRSYFQAKAPAEDMADAMAFLGAVSLGISTIGLIALKFMFKGVSLFGLKLFPSFTGLHGYVPFMVVAALMVPLAIVTLRLVKKLGEASAPKEKAK